MYKLKMLLVALLLTSAFVTKAQSQKKSAHLKVKVKKAKQPSDLSNFLTRNPTVADINWRSENNIIINLKSGKTQTYDIGNVRERKTFEGKYGAPPVAIPPPPPIEKAPSK